MKKLNFDKAWEFTLEKNMEEFNTLGLEKYSDAAGAGARFYDYNNWEKIDLPHDWSPGLGRDKDANTFAGAYPNTQYHRFTRLRKSEVKDVANVGWYRKMFELDPEFENKRVFIEFEGVFRDAVVFVNGVYLDRHNSGYTSFVIELTDHLQKGENSVAVRVDSSYNEGWWYEGAGIYRHVNLIVTEPVYFGYYKTAVISDLEGNVSVKAQLVNDTECAGEQKITWRILDKDKNEVARKETAEKAEPYSEREISATLKIENPHLWCPAEPYLYTLELSANEEKQVTTFGVRTAVFDADKGFLLNGKPLKIRGACCHQDFGGVGVALSDNLNEYKIKRLMEMGVNAYRCAHHAPSPVLLDICDRLGMLVMDETRAFGTSPEALWQLEALIERDRNHPSVIVWSLGNEEFSVQNEDWSYHLMKKATRFVKKLDPTRMVSYASHEGLIATGANGAAEIHGINYLRNAKGPKIDDYHRQHPTQPILGTEESSYVLSRGSAVNDLENGLLDSSGNVTMIWGSTPKGWVKFFEKRDYLAGSFMWTGFDYRGEPNPFYYSNVMSSFGTIDLCGMEKPPFYYYKSWWTSVPTLKLTPHWNHKKGEPVTVNVFTNCEEVSLYLNDKLIETKKVERFDAPRFTLNFEPGVLKAVGTLNGEILTDCLVTSGETAEVKCTQVLCATDEDDIAIYELAAFDKNGNFCPLASEEIEVTAENGSFVGVGNGDPANWDRERFVSGEDSVLISSFNSGAGLFIVPEKAPNDKIKRYDWLKAGTVQEGYEDDLFIDAEYCFGFEKTTQEFTQKISGVEDYEYIEFERFGGETEVYLNGEKIGDNLRIHGKQTRNTNRPYRFYCNFKKGENEIKVVSTRFESEQPAMSGYVKIGKANKPQWKIKLHYGKARLFVKSETPEKVKISAVIK